MLSVFLLDLRMPNAMMEAGERKTGLENASQIQLEMSSAIEIRIEVNKFQPLAHWRSEYQVQSDNVCKGWLLIRSSQDVGKTTKTSIEK